MLFYTIIMTVLNALAFLFSATTLVGIAKTSGLGPSLKVAVIFGAMILNMVICVTITLFCKFHVELILQNYTTLETLELKRQGRDP